MSDYTSANFPNVGVNYGTTTREDFREAYAAADAYVALTVAATFAITLSNG